MSKPNKLLKPSAIVVLSTALVSACAHTPKPSANMQTPGPVMESNAGFAKIAEASTPHAKDHAAILAMQGEYSVRFNFVETVSLSEGYVPKGEKKSGASELVLVVQNTPNKIVLQHLLVMQGTVIKHWRQDWEYQAKQRFEFVSDQTWRMRALTPELSRGAWTQCVFEVSDAPRYCGTGRFNHQNGVATWSSDRTWRPLPRREYTTRSDYNAIYAENRHTVTPNGWTHEQDNTKTVRNGEAIERFIVREFGFNDYRSTRKINFQAGRDYWQATQNYWAHVRSEWEKRFAQDGQVQLQTSLTDTQLMSVLEDQARTWLPENKKPGHTPSTEADAVVVQNALTTWTK